MKDQAATRPAAPAKPKEGLTAAAFRNLLDAFANAHIFEADPQNSVKRKLEEVRAMIEHHTTDDVWRERLHRAQEAAQQGKHEYTLLRFSKAQCADGGRAIQVGDTMWPTTLTGEAADLYRVWQNDLHPKGFRLNPRIFEFPPGKKSEEVGLVLSWASDD